jgi:hypothetical protein
VDCPPPDTDQRGVARPDGDARGRGDCDAGAVEFADCDASGVDDGTEIVQGILQDADANLVPDVCQPVLVPIDIKPGSERNPVNPMGRGVTPVAILGSDTFDVADVDVTTLAFGPDGAPLAHRNGPHVKDANHDRVKDLLAHFRREESGIAFGDTEACVTGELLDGTPFEGCDAISTLPPSCGIGFEVALLLPGIIWLRRRRGLAVA